MFKYTSITLGALLLAGCGGGSSVTVTDNNVDVIVPPVDPYLALKTKAQAELAVSKAPAVSIAVMKDGNMMFAQAYGAKINGGANDATTETLFQLGSTTKMFTAAATLQLVDENVLTLETALTDALPTLDLGEQHSDWQNISIQHLLTHQGGFEDVVDWSPGNGLMDYALNRFPVESGQMNPAGKFFNYSNPNWSYLGAIIEHQRNLPYEQVMKQSVFEPLGMTRTTMTYEDVKADGDYALGVGNAVINGQITNQIADNLEQIAEPAFGRPAGGYTWSTPSELVKMGQFLLNGNTDVLSDGLRQQMTESHVGMDMGLPVGYGYGLFVGPGFERNGQWYSLKSWEHGGNTLDYTNIFWVLPEQNVVIVIMSSGGGTNFSGTLVEAIKSVVQLPTGTDLPYSPIQSELFANHSGDYLLDGDTVSVFEQNNALNISMPANDAAGVGYNQLLRGIGESHFVATINGEEFGVTFFPDETGGLSTYVRNRNFVAIRKDSVKFSGKARTSNLLTPTRRPLTLN